jgi:hypothetical protein
MTYRSERKMGQWSGLNSVRGEEDRWFDPLRGLTITGQNAVRGDPPHERIHFKLDHYRSMMERSRSALR